MDLLFVLVIRSLLHRLSPTAQRAQSWGLSKDRNIRMTFAASRFVKPLLAFYIFGCGLAAAGQRNSSNSMSPVPVLLELFTSEGCSSCPPADVFLERLDTDQPIAGAHLIVLSEHVDYWDHQGWKDPYSSAAFTERQADYVRTLHLDQPYTPQIVLNGSAILRGDAQQLEQMLTAAASNARVPIAITSTTIEPGALPLLRLHIQAAGTSLNHSADVFLALALDHAESDVLHGENGGKHLRYVAVAEDIKKIGKIEKGKVFDQDLKVKVKPAMEKNNLRVIAFVQEPGHGKILGAAEQLPKE